MVTSAWVNQLLKEDLIQAEKLRIIVANARSTNLR